MHPRIIHFRMNPILPVSPIVDAINRAFREQPRNTGWKMINNYSFCMAGGAPITQEDNYNWTVVVDDSDESLSD